MDMNFIKGTLLQCIKNYKKIFYNTEDVDEILDVKNKFLKNKICLYQCLNFRFYGNYINKTNPYWVLPLTTTIKIAKI